MEKNNNTRALPVAAHTLTDDSPAYWGINGTVPPVLAPYRVEHSDLGPGAFFRIMAGGQAEHGVPVSGTGCRIASLGYGGNQEVNHRALAAANAAFIVRACNSHAALVEALEALVFSCEHGFLVTNKATGTHNEGATRDKIQQARAALSIAKEGTP